MKALLAIAFLGLGLAVVPAAAQAPENGDVGEVFVLSLGGKLYDNIFTMTEVP